MGRLISFASMVSRNGGGANTMDETFGPVM